MQKIRLDLDRLAVESFLTTSRNEQPRGTVLGRASTNFCTVSCADTDLNTCTGCGMVSNSGCAVNTEFCAFDSVNLCQEHAADRTDNC